MQSAGSMEGGGRNGGSILGTRRKFGRTAGELCERSGERMENSVVRYRIELGKWEHAAAHETGRTLIIGHRNPDTDSVTAAASYAALKNALGEEGYRPACAGLPQKRTQYVFQRFNYPLPEVVSDVWPKVGDIVRPCKELISAGQTQLQASDILSEQRVERMPVVDDGGNYLGMVSLFDLADRLFRNSGRDHEGVLDRTVETSIALAAQALEARVLICSNELDESLMHVFVGAMNLYHMKSRLLEQSPRNCAVVVGDRGEIHHLAIELGVRLLVITGNCEIDPEYVREAAAQGVSILVTPHDSASAVRRLKFSAPVRHTLDKQARYFSPNERLRDIRREALSANYDGFPVVEEDGQLVGMFYKQDMQNPATMGLILVDHNEIQQAVEGAEDVPIREIIDHHRLGMQHTTAPIRVLNDIVGSTCTLISELFRQNGVTPEPAVAGLLISGIITDTLQLRSPTATLRDRRMLEWLCPVAGCDPAELEKEILASGSPLANLTPEQLVNLDLKRYDEAGIRFAVGQVEEAGFENLAGCKQALAEKLAEQMGAEKLNFIALLVTNVVRSTSVMLAAGDAGILKKLPFEKLEDGMYDLPGLVSRKKQLLPVLMNIVSENRI